MEFVRGMQGEDPHDLKTISTPKHFAVHSGPESVRHTCNAVVDERDLRETCLPAFRAAVVDAHAGSVMCAYHRFRGEPCCALAEPISGNDRSSRAPIPRPGCFPGILSVSLPACLE